VETASGYLTRRGRRRTARDLTPEPRLLRRDGRAAGPAGRLQADLGSIQRVGADRVTTSAATRSSRREAWSQVRHEESPLFVSRIVPIGRTESSRSRPSPFSRKRVAARTNGSGNGRRSESRSGTTSTRLPANAQAQARVRRRSGPSRCRRAGSRVVSVHTICQLSPSWPQRVARARVRRGGCRLPRRQARRAANHQLAPHPRATRSGSRRSGPTKSHAGSSEDGTRAATETM